jgi:anthranilate phosphoribosyltransferase
MSLKHALHKVICGHDLSQAEARAAMRGLVGREASPALIAAFAVALRMKGETAEEIAGLAEVMRDLAMHVETTPDVVDIVGTGGDGSGTFNISTLSALVIAAAGGRVAKHGNRSITSAFGAADFLETMGVAIDLPPMGVARCVGETGFGFMFAPLYHPAMRHAAVPRREIGVRTVFNILGPLTNPAGARRQLTGVAAAGLDRTLAAALSLLGAEHALVVHSDDGLDEISSCAPTRIHEVHPNGDVTAYSVAPEMFGLRRRALEDLRGLTQEANLALANSVLDGRAGAPRDVVALNAGAGLYVAGLAESLADGVRMAAAVIDSGRVRAKVENVIAVSQRLRAETLLAEAA